MKKLYLSLVMSLLTAMAWAQSFTSGGLTFTVLSESEKTVAVTGCNPEEVSSDLELPENVSSEGVTYSLEEIADRAFAECTHLKTLSLPSTLSSLGAGAFAGSDLEAIKCFRTIPPFKEETTFTADTYTSAVVTVYASSIGNYRQLWQPFVNFVTMPDPPAEVDGLLYRDAPSRYNLALVGYVAGKISENLVIPDEVKTPTSYFPYSVQVINEEALANAPVKSVVFPSKCQTIGERVLAGCASLDSIVIPASVTKVGAHFTDGCDALKSVYFSLGGSAVNLGTAADSVLSMKDYTLYLNRDVAFTGAPETSPFAGDGLKHLVYGCQVSSTAGLFEKSTSLTRIDVASSATRVAANVFKGTPALEKVTFSENLSQIGNNAFADCPKLAVVILPEYLKTIGNGAFAGCGIDSVICTATTPATLPDDAFSEETYAGAHLIVPDNTLDVYKAADGWKNFANISELNGGKVPEPFTVDGVTYTVKSMDDMTVSITGYDAETIPEMLELPATVTNDGVDYTVASTTRGALSGAPIKYVKFPSTITTLANTFLLNCTSLDSIVVPASVTLIEPLFTANCTALKAVVMEPGETELDMGTHDDRAFFYGNYTLYLGRPLKMEMDSFNYPRSPLGTGVIGVVLYPEAGECANLFYPCFDLKTVEFAEGYTEVPESIFKGSSSIDRVVFPSTLTSIGSEAFYSCSALKTVTLPASLESIGNYAFRGETVLDSVTCMSRIPPVINENVFADKTYASARLIIPERTTEYYAAADGWKKFVNVEEMISSSSIDIDADAAEEIVTVVDLQGRVVYTGLMGSMPELNPGIYLVRTDSKTDKIIIR